VGRRCSLTGAHSSRSQPFRRGRYHTASLRLWEGVSNMQVHIVATLVIVLLMTLTG